MRKHKFRLYIRYIQAWILMSLFQCNPYTYAQDPKLMIPEGHSHMISALQFSSDNKTLLTTSDDGTAKLWDFETGKLIRTIEEIAKEPFNTGGFSPDGELVILLSNSGVLSVWKKNTGQRMASWIVTGPIKRADGGGIVTVENNTYDNIWGHRLPPPVDIGEFLKFSLDGRSMLVNTLSGEDVLWNTSTKKEIHIGSNYELTWTEGDKKIMALSEPGPGQTLRMLDAISGKEIKAQQVAWEHGSFSPDGTQYLSKNNLYSIEAPLQADVITAANEYCFFSPQGTYILTSSGKILHSKIRKLLYTLKMPENSVWSKYIVSSPSEKWIAVSSHQQVQIYNAATGLLVHSFPTSDHYFRLSWSADSKLLMRTRSIPRFSSGLSVLDQFSNENVSIPRESFTTDIWNISTAQHIAKIIGPSPVSTSNGNHILLPVRNQSDNISGDFSEIVEINSLSPSTKKRYLKGIAKFPNGLKTIHSKSELIMTRFGSQMKAWDSNSGRFLYESTTSLIGNGISPDGVRMLIADGNNLKLLDARTGKELFTLKNSNEIRLAAISKDGKRIIAATISELFNWDIVTGNLLQTIEGDFSDASQMVTSSNGRWLMVIQPEYSVLVDLLSGQTVPVDKEAVLMLDGVEFSNDSRFLITNSYEKNEIGFWRLDAKKIPKAQLLYGVEMTISNDGKFLAYSTMEDGTFFGSMESVIKQKNDVYLVGEDDANDLKFTADGEFLVASYAEDSIKTRVWNTKTKLATIELTEQLIEISEDSQFILTRSWPNEIVLRELSTGKILRKFTEGEFQDIDWEKEKILLFNSPKFILADLKNESKTLSWMLLDSADWVVTHPSGLFDASSGAMNKLYFVQATDLIEFSQLKERYYEPGLWKKIIAGEELRKITGLKSIDLPPDIELDALENGYLPIKLINKGGGIGQVTIFINGKEVIEDARDKDADAKADVVHLRVYLGNNKNFIKGTENFIAVKAWNADHWVVSRGKIISFDSKETEEYKPAIHILSCGVSDYTGTEIDLKYASKDAEDVSKAIQLGARRLFGIEKSYVYTLTTDRTKEFYPTKENILKTLEHISSTAHPLDVFVMYVSGHGINYGGQDGDWYYLTHDAYTGSISAYSDPAIRKQTTLSSNELVELFKKVPALKQVLMIDACASGKVVENLITQKDIASSTLRALDRMRDRTGMYIITGCTADAVSYEASKYGQGILTYSILEGIKGGALREEQYIDINKLFQYAQDRVPFLAEGIGGIQTPQVFSPQASQSFDIGLMTESEKREIPIAKIRPVYIRSNFQDEAEVEDILGVGKIMDEALNEVSAKGSDSKLIFVDVKDYPDGCKLIGRYQKIEGMISLKLKKKCGDQVISYEIKANGIEQLKSEILKIL